MKRELDAKSMEKVYEVITCNYLDGVFDELDGEEETSLDMIKEVKQILALLNNLGLIDEGYMRVALDMAQDDIVTFHKMVIEETLYEEMHDVIQETSDIFKL